MKNRKYIFCVLVALLILDSCKDLRNASDKSRPLQVGPQPVFPQKISVFENGKEISVNISIGLEEGAKGSIHQNELTRVLKFESYIWSNTISLPIFNSEIRQIWSSSNQILVWMSSGSLAFPSLALLKAARGSMVITELGIAPGVQGYSGHDNFQLRKDGVLLREYPLYKPLDANCCPSGGRVRVEYRIQGDGELKPIEKAN